MSRCGKRSRIGQRNQLITLIEETETEDANGDVAVSVNDVSKYWAKVVPVQAREDEKYGELRDIRVNLFIFPRSGPVSSALRIRWNGLEHNIEEVRDPGIDGEDMVIKAISGVAL